ncbi:MAG TPA: cellulose binding domain-containing protein, partial [Cellvibrio sp.]|nr:cellulose binding domain-containing protein [Cellvibrio sp.]
MSRFIQVIGCWLALCFAIPSFGLTPPGISASSSSNRTCAGVTSSAASSNPAVSALTCEVRVVNQWNAGYQIEVIVKNTGSVKIDDWRVYLSVPEFHSNSSLWNAVKTVVSPTQLMLSKPASNPPLQPGQSVSIGAVFNKPLGSTGVPSCHTQIIPPPNTAPKGDFSIDLSNDTVRVQN